MPLYLKLVRKIFSSKKNYLIYTIFSWILSVVALVCFILQLPTTPRFSAEDNKKLSHSLTTALILLFGIWEILSVLAPYLLSKFIFDLMHSNDILILLNREYIRNKESGENLSLKYFNTIAKVNIICSFVIITVYGIEFGPLMAITFYVISLGPLFICATLTLLVMELLQLQTKGLIRDLNDHGSNLMLLQQDEAIRATCVTPGTGERVSMLQHNTSSTPSIQDIRAQYNRIRRTYLHISNRHGTILGFLMVYLLIFLIILLWICYVYQSKILSLLFVFLTTLSYFIQIFLSTASANDIGTIKLSEALSNYILDCKVYMDEYAHASTSTKSHEVNDNNINSFHSTSVSGDKGVEIAYVGEEIPLMDSMSSRTKNNRLPHRCISRVGVDSNSVALCEFDVIEANNLLLCISLTPIVIRTCGIAITYRPALTVVLALTGAIAPRLLF